MITKYSRVIADPNNEMFRCGVCCCLVDSSGKEGHTRWHYELEDDLNESLPVNWPEHWVLKYDYDPSPYLVDKWNDCSGSSSSIQHDWQKRDHLQL